MDQSAAGRDRSSRHDRRALDALLVRLEKRRGAAPLRTRRVSDGPVPPAPGGRAIPARVRRAVWERDRGRCTFTGSGGRQCGSERMLDFDHAVPFAHGGEVTVDGLRLRCRAHNQLEAERSFGREFMQHKRTDAAGRRDREVELALRGLGCRGEEARRGAAHAAALGATTVEERLRGALRYLGAARSLAGAVDSITRRSARCYGVPQTDGGPHATQRASTPVRPRLRRC